MKQITEQIANEIGGSLHRLEELKTKSIVESGDAAERRGLEQFLNRVLLEHASELLGSWLTIRHEYAPLVRGFATLIKNADSILVRPQTEAKAVKAEPETPKQAEVK